MKNENESRVITQEEWKRILRIMQMYHRFEGYVDFTPDGRFEFFDGDPMIGGIHACKVTRDEVERYSRIKR